MRNINDVPTHCAGCDHTLSNHKITLTKNGQTVNAECRICTCNGKLYAE